MRAAKHYSELPEGTIPVDIDVVAEFDELIDDITHAAYHHSSEMYREYADLIANGEINVVKTKTNEYWDRLKRD